MTDRRASTKRSEAQDRPMPPCIEPFLGRAMAAANSDERADGRASLLGNALRSARAARGLSQLELALRIGISSRHLGFLELGRSRPSHAMLMTILEELDPPRSVRNATLLAGGFPPMREAPAEAGSEFLTALHSWLEVHDPYPAILFDADWYCRGLSVGARALCGLLIPDPQLVNAGQASFDMIEAVARPSGLLARARSPERAAASLLSQFWTEVWARPSLIERVRTCAASLEARYGALPPRPRDPAAPYLDLCFETEAGLLHFYVVQTVPGLPQDVSTEALRVELWYPRDAHTREVMASLCSAGHKEA